MLITDLALAPWRAARLAVRAAEDLNAIAERARRDPDPAELILEQLLGLRRELTRITAVGEGVVATGQTLITGGADLNRTAERLDGQATELIVGGADLTATAKEIDAVMQQFRLVLPQLLSAVSTVEDLEEAAGKVADTVEPLQGVARGVGRLTGRG
ncbi:MAG: hypothetical protein JWM31_3008 [Solirubrobacterales bacterium]|nr:hypothetical protein [Solirubrobacterales bacterium]